MMRQLKIVTTTAISLLCLSPLVCAGAQEPRGNAPAQNEAVRTYPESEDGLKALVDDMLAAQSARDKVKTATYLSNLIIPDHEAWFAKIFGREEGARLESKYVELLPQMPDKISQRFKYAIDGQRTDVKITVLQKPVDPSARLGRAITEAMLQPIPIYLASGASPNEKFPATLGEFVYVEGAFQSLDMDVYQVLSTAPPMRIRQGGNVTAATILHKVTPSYPKEAIASHAQGNVVLHIILGTDGTVKEVTPVSGDPDLVKAAIDAVKQWTYKPTLLNGKPVEVDTTITVEFHL
jgi:TonB family protein